MPIRINDIESTLRIGIEGAVGNLDKAATGAERFGTRLAKADRDLGKFGRGVNQAAQASDAAFALIEQSSGKSLGSVQAATAGVLGAAGQTAIVASTVGNVSGAVTKLTANLGGLTTALSVGLVGALILVAGFAAKAVVDLNKVSAATEKIDDSIAKSSALPKFRAEAAALSGTIKRLEEGTISLADAQEEFNRFGLDSVEQAKQRVEALKGVTARLADQKKATDDLRKAETDRLEILNEIAKQDEQRNKQALIDIELSKRQEEIDKRVAAIPLPEQPFGPPEATTGLQDILKPGAPIAGGIEDLTADAVDLGGTLNDVALDGIKNFEELSRRTDAVTSSIEKAAEIAGRFGEDVTAAVNGAAVGLAGLTVQFGENLLFAAGKGTGALGRMFKQLLADLARAIIQALLLNKVIGSIGGGGALGFIGGLFQDPKADLFARFEGARFADLFFQGVERQIGGIQDRVSATLDQNRDVVESQGRPISVVVNEASPETKTEVTDRDYEPRIRRRALQRTGSSNPQQGLI